MGSEQIAHLLYLLAPGKTHREDMVSSARLVQIHIAKSLIDESMEAHERL